jgi:D-alanyl-D-alanine carboxypeptidase/D-alanyl-D-alanine-endopeptidase (penicillin-binding protein 4)
LALTWASEIANASGHGPTDRRGVTAEQARDALEQWAQNRLSGPGLRLENGSGLSREQRLTAEQVATLLRLAWMSPVMPDLMASLPVAGAPDGTLRRLQQAAGRAHLKTGSLRDVAAVAGYALGRSGQRWIVVVMIHHEQAQAARPALEALVQWAIQDEPTAPVVRTNPRNAPP